MPGTRTWLALWGLVAVLGACKTVPEVEATHRATLVISADLRGYLAPCGCSENMRGGIARAAFQIAKARETGDPVFFIDSGNALFGAPTIAPEAVPQQERKAQALAQAFEAMGLHGRAVGPLDNARGDAFRTSLHLAELPEVSLLNADIATVVAPTLEAVPALGRKARQRGARFVVALVQQPFDALLPAASQDPEELGANLLIAANAKDELSTEDNKLVGGTTRIAQLQSKGRSLLRVDLTFSGKTQVAWLRGGQERERELAALATRIELLRAQVNEPMLRDELKALRKGKLEEVIARREALAAQPLAVPAHASSATARFVPLEANFEQLESVKAIVTAYDRDVGLLNLAYAKEHGHDCEAPGPNRSGYVGSAACAACHAPGYALWQQTKHAKAYAALENEGKNHHLDCVGCHLTGWQKPGGVCRIDQTTGRTEVGCEACHGPGSAHVRTPTKLNITREVGAATCVGCHDHENAPHFSYEAYLPKVLGPGHGQ